MLNILTLQVASLSVLTKNIFSEALYIILHNPKLDFGGACLQNENEITLHGGANFGGENIIAVIQVRNSSISEHFIPTTG